MKLETILFCIVYPLFIVVWIILRKIYRNSINNNLKEKVKYCIGAEVFGDNLYVKIRYVYNYIKDYVKITFDNNDEKLLNKMNYWFNQEVILQYFRDELPRDRKILKLNDRQYFVLILYIFLSNNGASLEREYKQTYYKIREICQVYIEKNINND